MTDDDDEVIRSALRAAHADDDPPPFRRAQPVAPRRSFAPLVALGVAIAAAAVWLAWPRATTTSVEPPVAHEGNYAIPEIASPTDFLLATPGADLLTTTPTFGVDSDVTKGTLP